MHLHPSKLIWDADAAEPRNAVRVTLANRFNPLHLIVSSVESFRELLS